MRSVLASTSHPMAFPDQTLNRSIANSSRCTLSLPCVVTRTKDGALGRLRAPSGYLRGCAYLNIALYETGSGVGMLIASAQGKTRWAHCLCESSIFTNSGLSFDSLATTVSHALSSASRTDCGVLMILIPLSRSFL